MKKRISPFILLIIFSFKVSICLAQPKFTLESGLIQGPTGLIFLIPNDMIFLKISGSTETTFTGGRILINGIDFTIVLTSSADEAFVSDDKRTMSLKVRKKLSDLALFKGPFTVLVSLSDTKGTSILAATHNSAGTDMISLSFETTAQGEFSSITRSREVVVKNRDDFNTLFQEMGKGFTPPQVDFNTQMVIGIFLGNRPTSGYSVKITNVSMDLDGKIITVQAVENVPPPGTMVVQVITNPYHLISIPKRDAEVKFIKTVLPVP